MQECLEFLCKVLAPFFSGTLVGPQTSSLMLTMYFSTDMNARWKRVGVYFLTSQPADAAYMFQVRFTLSDGKEIFKETARVLLWKVYSRFQVIVKSNFWFSFPTSVTKSFSVVITHWDAN